jgi:hypothetical protein
VKGVAIVAAGVAPCRSPSVEKALQELAQLAVTEACVSGSCDICLFQTDPCSIIGQYREDSHPSGLSGEKKNK